MKINVGDLIVAAADFDADIFWCDQNAHNSGIKKRAFIVFELMHDNGWTDFVTDKGRLTIFYGSKFDIVKK